MSNHLIRPDESKEFLTNERCHILEMLDNHDTQKPFSLARARVEPGVTTRWHRLSEITEFYYIIEGTGMMEIGDKEGFEVQKNDIIQIPPNEAQRIHNTGVEDLVFICICNPPFTDSNYEELE